MNNFIELFTQHDKRFFFHVFLQAYSNKQLSEYIPDTSVESIYEYRRLFSAGVHFRLMLEDFENINYMM